MNKSMLASIEVGVAAVLGITAVVSSSVLERGSQYMQIVSAIPIKESVETPCQEYQNVAVTHCKPVRDENRTAGSILGTVTGDIIGHQFGDGRGKDIATMTGALDGDYTGNQIQGSVQENDTCTTTQQHCKMVYDKPERILGYDMTCKTDDQQEEIRMDRGPDTQAPLDNNG